ncbi:MAG: hypothetical protein FJ086_20175 [Deltaproteobacteria bacterium]|nr:hypothetical protein [Deltaproteobacteria bacterium]
MVVLLRTEAVAKVSQVLREQYRARHGRETLLRLSRPSGGAHLVVEESLAVMPRP